MAAIDRDDELGTNETGTPAVAEEHPRTVQQRFEDSVVGRRVISGFVVVFLFFGVVWGLPISPIADGLQRVLAPVAAPLGLDQWWGVFATPDTRLGDVEVDVAMENGETRVWTMQPGAPGVGVWARWMLLTRHVINDQYMRPQVAHWVVRHVTKPGEHAVGVTVVLRTQNLSKPGEPPAGKSPATKVLYQETLGARS